MALTVALHECPICKTLMSHDPYCSTVLVPILDGTNESRPFLLNRFGAQFRKKLIGHDPYSWPVEVPGLDGTNESWPSFLHRFSAHFVQH
jgi:hypothetical protein